MPEQDKGAAPPDGGRMSHDAMDRASELPVTGPAATDTLAASGGLDLPGRAREGSTPNQQQDRADAEQVPPPTQVSRREDGLGGVMEKERFPGEREPDTAMPSQPGIMGTTGFGGDLPETTTDATVSEQLAEERANEGGGDEGQR